MVHSGDDAVERQSATSKDHSKTNNRVRGCTHRGESTCHGESIDKLRQTTRLQLSDDVLRSDVGFAYYYSIKVLGVLDTCTRNISRFVRLKALSRLPLFTLRRHIHREVRVRPYSYHAKSNSFTLLTLSAGRGFGPHSCHSNLPIKPQAPIFGRENNNFGRRETGETGSPI